MDFECFRCLFEVHCWWYCGSGHVSFGYLYWLFGNKKAPTVRGLVVVWGGD